MAPVPGRAILNRVILRVYDSVQHAGSQEEYELGTISLRMLSATDGRRYAGSGMLRCLWLFIHPVQGA